MKTKYITTIILPMLALCAAGLTACEEESIGLDAGTLQDEESFALIRSAMRSDHSFSGITKVDLFAAEEGENPETVIIDELFLTLDKPATGDVTAEIIIGDTFTEEYLAEVERRNAQVKAYWNKTLSIAPETEYFKTGRLPINNLQLNSSTLTVKSGKTDSESTSVIVINEGLDLQTIYFLPMEIRQKDASGKIISRLLQYIITINEYKQTVEENNYSVPKDVEIRHESETGFMSVYYINTEFYQPLLVDNYLLRRENRETYTYDFYTIGSIINLRPAYVDYEYETGRSSLSVSLDLRYVLENATKYIRPIQNNGKKVCVCIQGGGKGLGFCNMTDTQIADFAAQVKDLIDIYGLDGINLWDEGSGYGKEGMPPVNTTSYPKLIRSLREAMPDKLLTLVDKEEPTEYFHDVALCGGIEVGKYIDYAWHGYNDAREIIQVIDPWSEKQQFSEYTRAPIAGLSSDRYGNVNIPKYGAYKQVPDLSALYQIINTDAPIRLINWKLSKQKNNNIIVFGFDLTANEQNESEGYLQYVFDYYRHFHDEGSYLTLRPNGSWRIRTRKYSFDFTSLSSRLNITYNVFYKDW